MKINLHTWFGKRQLNFCPKHFIRASTALDDEKLFWVLETLHGRFFVSGNSLSIIDFNDEIYFEDTQDLMLYELTWS